MKKNLPNNPLRDQLDSIHHEFEEAHWDNLASRLHAESGGNNGGNRFYSNRTWWYLSIVFLGLFVASGIYWFSGPTEESLQKNPVVVESSILPANQGKMDLAQGSIGKRRNNSSRN